MRRLSHYYRCAPEIEPVQALRSWYGTALGKELMAQEQTEIGQVLADLFGYHLLQIGQTMPADLLAPSRIRHRVVMGDGRCTPKGDLCGDFHALPFESDSIDVALLPHTLELTEQPHQLLREVDRILIPEGYVIINGFNPWSLCGLARLSLGWRRRLPWCSHFYTLTRIRDWLELLGFEVVLTRHLFYRPPLQRPRLLQRLQRMESLGDRWWPPLGGSYLLVAQKRTVKLTPIKPRWRPRRSLIGNGLPKPTIYGQQRRYKDESG